MNTALDRGVLRRQPKTVPAHRGEDVKALHRLVSGQQVTVCVIPHVTLMDRTRRIWIHADVVELGPGRVFRDLKDLFGLPAILPFGLNCSVVVTHLKTGG